MDERTLDRLLDTLEAGAKSNTELAGEVRQQGEKITTLAGEVRGLAVAVERSTAVATTLAAHYQAQERDQEEDRQDRQARRTLWVRAGSAVWGVAKSPLGVLLAALVGWLAATHLATPAPFDTRPAQVDIEGSQGATEGRLGAPGGARDEDGADAQAEGSEGLTGG